MEGLEGLKELGRFEITFLDEDDTITDQVIKDTEEYKVIEKELKALKIVKEKEVNTRFLKQMLRNQGWVRYETYQDYLRKDCEEFKRAYLSVSLVPLTQEEFDLLMEVFK